QTPVTSPRRATSRVGAIPPYFIPDSVIRAEVSENDHVIVTGASGGVGSAAVQLAKRRGAKVTALASGPKLSQVAELGADVVMPRTADLIAELGEQSATVLIDNVAGPGYMDRIKLLSRGGRFTSSGAIAGPIVEFDLRDFYLRDLRFIGCTAWDEPVFPNLVRYIEAGEIKPLLAKEFPLEQIADAQQEFMRKDHFGNFVLIPPA
ncbi:MAG: zinc-binding dehydrogenase, partial [Pseudomonadota bacterium]